MQTQLTFPARPAGHPNYYHHNFRRIESTGILTLEFAGILGIQISKVLGVVGFLYLVAVYGTFVSRYFNEANRAVVLREASHYSIQLLTGVFTLQLIAGGLIALASFLFYQRIIGFQRKLYRLQWGARDDAYDALLEWDIELRRYVLRPCIVNWMYSQRAYNVTPTVRFSFSFETSAQLRLVVEELKAGVWEKCDHLPGQHWNVVCDYCRTSLKQCEERQLNIRSCTACGVRQDGLNY